MGFELFTKGMQDANEILNRNFAAVETQLNGMSIQLYVSINGSDESGDGTQDKPYRTIQKAVDAIKPYHTDASIIIGAGDYDESVEIRNKTASIGLSRETRENKVKLKYIGAAYCRQIWLDGLSFDGTGLEGDRPCINVMCVNNMQIHYCEIAGGPAIGGIGLDSASAYVANTAISNCGRAITVIYNSLLTARGVGGAGNQIGYSAHSSTMIILHTVVHGWGQNKKNPYKTLIFRSMMKFQGRQTVNNLLVSTVLIAGGCFGLFFLPMMGSSQLLETKNRPFDYLFQYRADQNVPTKTAIEELAGQYNLDLKDWSSGEYLYLALDGQEIFEDGRSYHYEYTPLLQGGKFLSESSFSELTGMDVDVKPGTYKGVSNDEETGTYFMNLKSELLTNLSTMSTCDTKFDGFIHYGLLVDQRGYYVLDDADYAAMKEGISDEYRGNMFAFNINGEDSYDFAYELFLAFMGSFTEDCELPIYYDPVEKYACEQRGETYWGDTGEMTQVSFDDPDSSDFRMYWTYMPKIRILDQNDHMRTYAVYLMMFLFIAIICILAAMVIGYTRCQTIALNNRYLFDDLKKLGASSAFLTREVKSQCKKVFRTPSIIGISLMFLLYSLIMFGNDGALTYSEIIGLFACAGSLLIVSLVIYMVYRLTVGKVKEELNIH